MARGNLSNNISRLTVGLLLVLPIILTSNIAISNEPISTKKTFTSTKPPPYVKAKTVTLCTEHWPPFIIVNSKDNSVTGPWISLLDTLFSAIPEYKMRITVIPWERCLMEIKEGRQDGTFSHFKKPEREVYMDFTSFVVSDRSLVWYSTKNIKQPFHWTNYRDLAPYKFGAVTGEKFSRELDELIANNDIKTERVTTEVINFRKLARGRIDITVKNERVGWALVKELNIKNQVKPASKPAYEKKRYISFSKKVKLDPLIELLNTQLELMKSKGRAREILGYTNEK